MTAAGLATQGEAIRWLQQLHGVPRILLILVVAALAHFIVQAIRKLGEWMMAVALGESVMTQFETEVGEPPSEQVLRDHFVRGDVQGSVVPSAAASRGKPDRF